MRTIEWKNGIVTTIDQTKLPNQIVSLRLSSCSQVADAIKTMKIRGAPLLGATAAFGLALTAYNSKKENKRGLIEALELSANVLRKTRPTAVNLFWAINRVLKNAKNTEGDVTTVIKSVIKEAQLIADEDVEINRAIGKNGEALLDNGDIVLTHCNAGSLATVDYGTALGVIRSAKENGKDISVIATETRPFLQGARLTTFELHRDDIPVKLITDSMVGYVLSRGLIDKIIVGADRIVKDAVINKIGTYTIAVLARINRVPFYVAAPKSTFDFNKKANEVEIEERDSKEVANFHGIRIVPKGVFAINPAFDITPLEYVTAIICEDGIIHPSSNMNSQLLES